MKSTITKIAIGIILGVCLTITCLSVYLVIQTQSRLATLESFAVQMVSLINNPQKQK